MKNIARNLVLAGSMLLVATSPVFASLSGSDPRPSSTPPSGASIVVGVFLSTLGL